jgi:hypothetical protein
MCTAVERTEIHPSRSRGSLRDKEQKLTLIREKSREAMTHSPEDGSVNRLACPRMRRCASTQSFVREHRGLSRPCSMSRQTQKARR